MLDEAQLREWGLDSAQLGPADAVEWPSSRAALGLAPGRWPSVVVEPARLTALVDQRFEGARFVPAAVPALDECGACVELLESWPGIAKFMAAAGTGIEVRGAGLSPHGLITDRDDPGTVFMDLAATGPVVVVTGGAGVACWLDNDRIVFRAVLFPVIVPPMGAVEAPLLRWCDSLSDQWLASEIRARARAGHGWQTVVAVGLLDRLLPPGMEVTGQEIYRWVTELDASTREIIEEIAVADAESMAGALLDIELEPAPDDPAWQEQVLAACHRRDDLEGVRRILQEAGAGLGLNAALEEIDEQGLSLRFALPWFSLDDERLRRVAARDVEAWWAQVFGLEAES